MKPLPKDLIPGGIRIHSGLSELVFDLEEFPPWDFFAEDREILDEIELESFQAVPSAIRPYEETTLSWQLAGPTEKADFYLVGEAIQVDWDNEVVLDRVPVSHQGTRAAYPLTTTPFELIAERGHAVKRLGLATVTVDTSEQVSELLLGSQFEDLLVNDIERHFAHNPQMGLRSGSHVVADFVEPGLDISLPLTINIPNFFNADADITFAFRGIISSRGGRYHNVLAVTHPDVDCNIYWEWYEQALTAFIGHVTGATGGACLTIVEVALEAVVESLIPNMMGDIIADGVADLLNGFPIFGLLARLRAMAGNGERPYLLHSLETQENGIRFYGVPDPREGSSNPLSTIDSVYT